jgi:capsular exopolysaccharide synthesis family protein
MTDLMERQGPTPARSPGREPRRPAAVRAPVAPARSAPRLDDHLVTLLTPGSIEAEQYRSVQYQLEPRHARGDLSVVAVTSPCAGDGKTTTAINLAGVLARGAAARVLLVDADLRLPSVQQQLGLEERDVAGLVDAILDPGIGLVDVVRRLPLLDLSVLPAGRPAPAPYEAIASPRLAELLQEARRLYDYVVVDTPPMLPVPDCRILAPQVDGFLIVVAAHRTPRRLLEEALQGSEPAKVLGLVFNNDDRLLSRTYGYYGYGGYARPGHRRGGGRSGRDGPLRSAS